jgi:hypothetical protein
MTRPADKGRMRRLLLALFALVLLAGCGGGGGSSLLATAIQKTEDAGGAEVVFHMTMEMPGVAQPIEMTGGGVEDAGEQRAHLTFDMSSLGASVPGAAALCGSGCELELVADGLSMYMRSGMFGAGLGGKEWVKMDVERIGSSMGLEMGAAGGMGQTASDQLRLLEAASDDLAEHGREQVAGVGTTRYSATIDVSRLPEGEQIVELTGMREMPVGVWIDDADRVRRIAVEQTLSQAGIEMKMRLTAEYVRFGVPVEIDVPDEADVFDATDLVAGELE